MKTYTLKVAEIKTETDDTVTICFKQPGLKKIKYSAGQYITLIFRINGRRYLRPYSFSSAFGVDPYLEVTVKRVVSGLVSNYINDNVKIGDSIEVLEPMGDFQITSNRNFKNIFFWGVGSGVTPLYSLIKSILKNEFVNDINLHLIYGNHNAQSSIFWKDLHKLQTDYSDRFKITHFHTRLLNIDDHSISIKGRIEPELILKDYGVQEIENSLHYICGPLDLKENIKKILNSYNLNKDQILIEDFEILRDPADFKDIEGETVLLDFNNEIKEIFVEKGKSILESALDNNIELPYSCQTGSCSMCKGTLKNGNCKMIGIERRDDLSEDEFLLCCTYPLSYNVNIKV